MNNSHLSEKEIILKCEEIEKFKHKCKCGHSVVIANKSGRALCQYCHNFVFKDAKTEFEYRMKEKQTKERRNLK